MGYVVGAFAGLVLASIAGQFLLHDFQAGLIPGLALALWIGSAINHDAKEEKLNLLCPIPLKYPLPVKQAYPKVKKLIREYTHNYGRSFKIHPTNPSQTKELKADMTWTDTDEVADPSPNDYGKTRKTSVQRHIRLEIYFKSPDTDSTVIEIRWYPVAEGLNPRACEPVIREVNEQIRQLLGEGTTDLPPKQPWIPPVWLHIATIACIALYVLVAIGKAGALWDELQPMHEKNAEQEKSWKQKLADLEAEEAEWQRFKKTFRPPEPGKPHDPESIFLPPQPPPSHNSPSTGSFSEQLFSKPKPSILKNSSTRPLFERLDSPVNNGGSSR